MEYRLPDDCCFAKNSMKPKGHSLNSMNLILISIIYLFIIIIIIIIIII